MKRKILISLLLIIATLLSLSSCDKGQRIEYCELGIILTKDFKSYDAEGSFSVAYSDGKTVVGISRFSFVDCEELGLPSTMTPLKLAEVYLERMDLGADRGVESQGDVPYFTYTASSADGGLYFYMPTFYRTPYAYFVITFITPAVRAAEAKAEYLGYISTAYILTQYL